MEREVNERGERGGGRLTKEGKREERVNRKKETSEDNSEGEG